MNRHARVVVVLAVIVGACGGGEDTEQPATPAAGATTTASTAAPETTAATTSPPVAAGDDFCDFVADFRENATASPLGMGAEELEQVFNANLDAMREAAAIAPSEHEGDVRIFIDAYSGFVEFLDEYDYNFFAIGEDALDDPRIAAMDAEEIDAAAARIAEHCGMDRIVADDDGLGEFTAGGGGVPGASLPEGFPDELVPPGGELLGSVTAGGGLSVNFSVSGDIDAVIDYYTDLLGNPLGQTETPRGAFWAGPYGDAEVSVAIVETAPGQFSINVGLL